MNEKYKNLASNMVVFAVGNAFSKAIQFVLLPVYTAYMTEAAYGMGELLSGLTQLVYPVITLCLYEALFRFVLDRDGNPKVIFSTVMLLVCALIPFALVVGLLLEIVINAESSFLCALLSVTSALRLCFMNFARGLGAVKRFALSGILNTMALLGGALVFICSLGMGASGYLLNYVVADIFTVVFLFATCKIWKYISVRSFSKPLLRDMLQYSLPLLPNALFWWFTSVFNRYIVLFFCGSSIAGLYAAAGKLPSLVNFLSTIFQQAWQISATQEYESDDNEGAFYSKTFAAFSFVMFLGTSLLLACVYPLSLLLLRDGFFDAWTLGPGLVLAAATTCFTAFFTTFFNAAKETVPIFKSTVLGAIVNVVTCLGLVFLFGVWGAVVASIIAQVVILIYRVYSSRRLVSLDVDAPALVVGVAVIFLQTFAQSVWAANGVPFAAILFCVLLLAYLRHYRSAISSLAAGVRQSVFRKR